MAPVLARGRRVYTLDLRGRGRSDWPGAYSNELMRADVLRFLNTLGLDRVELIGHSMGGIVAYPFAEDHPQRVSRLVLGDTPLPRPREAATPTRPDGDLAFDRWRGIRGTRHLVGQPEPSHVDRAVINRVRTVCAQVTPEDRRSATAEPPL
ncbi:alpha/beta fold hydrolase [Streptomyces sp. NPDC101151]|uniref:alpha/beta fold hydrolase n=1 Tax=Streptomyces sp. NPDC101151 TaxID=3366115 RepID=UPI00380AFC0D